MVCTKLVWLGLARRKLHHVASSPRAQLLQRRVDHHPPAEHVRDRRAREKVEVVAFARACDFAQTMPAAPQETSSSVRHGCTVESSWSGVEQTEIEYQQIKEIGVTRNTFEEFH